MAEAQANLNNALVGERPSELAQIQAQVAAAQAEVLYANKELARNQSLVASGSTSQQNLDKAIREAAIAHQSVKRFEAELTTAKLPQRIDLIRAARAALATSQAQLAAAKAAELVVEVDDDGNVLRVVTRAEMRAQRLKHRCTYVVVMTPDEQVWVHRRADWKDIAPGWWDLAFGGVCDVGEPWAASAARELEEEAGLVVDEAALEDLGAVAHSDEYGSIVGRAYVVRTDAEPVCNDGEVVELDRVPLAELAAWMVGRDVCIDSAQAVAPRLLAP